MISGEQIVIYLHSTYRSMSISCTCAMIKPQRCVPCLTDIGVTIFRQDPPAKKDQTTIRAELR